MSLFIRDTTTEIKWITHMTDFEVEVLESDISKIKGPKPVTHHCRGGNECLAKDYSLHVNGAPGKTHLCDHRGLTLEKYLLRYKKNKLVHVSKVGICNHTFLKSHPKPTPEQIRARKEKREEAIEAMGEFRTVIVLFGEWLTTFQQVWELASGLSNKKAWEQFSALMNAQNWKELIAFLGTETFKKSVPKKTVTYARKKVKRESSLAHEQRIKNKALICMAYIRAMIDEANASQDMSQMDYSHLMNIWFKTKENLLNTGYPNATPPLDSTPAQIVAFLDVERDPVYIDSYKKSLAKQQEAGVDVISFDELILDLVEED
jgi:hypothetical protein